MKQFFGAFSAALLPLLLVACSGTESDCPPFTPPDIAAIEVADLEVLVEVVEEVGQPLDVVEADEVVPDVPFELEVTPECDDGIDCTVDSWFWGQGCLFKPDDSLCDDGNACTADSCHAEAGCLHEPTSDPCEDGNRSLLG